MHTELNPATGDIFSICLTGYGVSTKRVAFGVEDDEEHLLVAEFLSLGEGKFTDSGDGDRLDCLVVAVVPADLLPRECKGTLLPVRLFGAVLPIF